LLRRTKRATDRRSRQTTGRKERIDMKIEALGIGKVASAEGLIRFASWDQRLGFVSFKTYRNPPTSGVVSAGAEPEIVAVSPSSW
jgi:hypothetical protein